jgi:copper transport protein
VPAATVSAHASLQSSSPAANAVLERGPVEIVLRFDEDVEASLSTIEVFDGEGAALSVGEPASGEPLAGAATSDDGSVVAAPLPDGASLPDGLYAVRWTVTSLDGHVIEGAFAFQVGTAGGGTAADLLSSIGTSGTRDATVDVAYAVARFVSLFGLVVLAGSGLWAVQRGGTLLALRRVRSLLVVGAAALVIGSIASLLLFAEQVGRGLVASLDVTTGRMLLVRSVAAVVLAALALGALRPESDVRREDWWRLAVTLASGAALLGFSAAGHAAALDPQWLWVALDMVHLAGATLWLGGVLLLVPLPRTVLVTPDTEFVARRFSTVVTIAVPVVVATGAVQTLRLAGGLDDLTATDWGRLLLVKVTVVVAVLGLAGAARWLLAREGAASLRRTMMVEAVAGLVVLGLVAALVGQGPRDLGAPEPFEATLTVDGAIAAVSVSPGSVGINEIHIVVTPPGGSLVPVADVQARASLTGGSEPAVPATLVREGPDHFSGTVAFTASGTWTLELIVSVDEASSSLVSTVIDIP